MFLGLDPRLRYQQHKVMSHNARSSAHPPARAPMMVTECGMPVESPDERAVAVGLAVLVLDAVLGVGIGVGSGGENASR